MWNGGLSSLQKAFHKLITNLLKKLAMNCTGRITTEDNFINQTTTQLIKGLKNSRLILTDVSGVALNQAQEFNSKAAGGPSTVTRDLERKQGDYDQTNFYHPIMYEQS